MKNLFFTLITFNVNILLGQIGIGTKDIDTGLVLKMDSKNSGILIPRLALQGKNIQAPLEGEPKTGLIVYNTQRSGTPPNYVSRGFYYWDEKTSSWTSAYIPISHSIAKFANYGTNVDFNTKVNPLNIFDVELFNEDPSLYKKYLDGIKIYETGLYKFTLNLDMDGTSDRDIFEIDIFVDDNKIPETFYVCTVDNAAGSSQDIGYVFTVYINIPRNRSGSYIYFKGKEVDGAAKVTFRKPKTSSVTIEKVR